MTKKELAEMVGDQLSFIESRAQAVQVVEAVLQCISEGVRDDGKVSLNGFGSFKMRERSERVGINPSTRERMTIPATRTVAFVPSPALREAVGHESAESLQHT